MHDDDEIVQAFLEESRENLDVVDRDLVALEARGEDPELLARVFRTIHTIKGTCGFLGFHRLAALTHAGEGLLGALRSGDVRVDTAVATSLLGLVDAVRAALARIESDGTDDAGDHTALIAGMERQARGEQRSGTGPSGLDDTALPSALPDTSVRVDVAVLDQLMDLVGELVLARNQIGELADDDGALASPFRRLRLVTSDLQDGVMRARLQTLGRVTGKFHRVARDLADTLGKQLRVEVDGQDVAVDKAINEALRDPLLHLVRNAVDHGLEPPAERVARGKPATGLLRIHAFHAGGRVHVEVSDDGRGVDAEALVRRAVELGVLAAEQATQLGERDALALMFHPGLSTAREVTSVSGRGVGMDVVRANLEQIGGTVELASQPGRGTTFHISVPLTLSIMPALLVRCDGQRYAVPQVDVREVLRLDADQITGEVDDIGGARVHRLRGEMLPLVSLADVLGLDRLHTADRLEVIVTDAGSRRMGLVVDAVGETTEAVVKPLTRATSRIPVFAGVTILPDGTPALVLDIAAVAARGGVPPTRRGATEPAHEVASAVDPRRLHASSSAAGELLLASSSGGARVAVRTADVHRLERFPRDQVGRRGSIGVVPYEGELLALVPCDAVLAGAEPDAADAPAEEIETVVCTTGRGFVGLTVHKIDDVVACSGPLHPPAGAGVRGAVVIDGEVIEVLDPEAVAGVVALAGAGEHR